MQAPILRTTEVRWFFEGGQNDTAWLTWFLSGSKLPLIQEGELPPENVFYATAQQPRTDRYMVVPEAGNFCIKQRQGCLEVKVQLASALPFQSADAETGGSAAPWMKWSFSPRDDMLQSVFANELQLAASWIDVEKQRYLIHAEWDADQGALVPAAKPSSDASESPPALQFELTQLNLPTAATGPHPWLTFSIELTDHRVPVQDICRAFCASRGPTPDPLTLAASQTYPLWLAARLGLPSAPVLEA